MLPARGAACIFSRLWPIFTTVCFTIYFRHSGLVLNSLESLFSKIPVHLFILFGLVALAGRI